MGRTEQVTVEIDGENVTIVGSGALDLYNEDLIAALHDEPLSAESLVVDLRSATYIDTAVLAGLAGAAKKMIQRDKRLKVLLLEGTHPLRTLRITGLSQIMDLVLEDVQGAE